MTVRRETSYSPGINRVMEEQVTTTTTSQPNVSCYSLENVRDMGSMGRMLYRKDAVKFLGVHKRTVMRYEQKGLLIPIKNQVNGRVMYTEANVVAVLGSKLKQTKRVVLYCRVAVLGSRGEPGESAPARLARQVDRMQDYCVRAGIRVDEVIKDVGPVNGRKALEGHDKLIELVMRKQVSLLVVETEDRIARWGMGHLFRRFLEWHGVEVHVASPVLLREEYREEIKQDLTELIYEAKRSLGEIG